MPSARLEIPTELQRNSPNVLAIGVEETGAAILDRGNRLLGWSDLAGRDVLDVGCGVRFTQTILNRALPVGSYTGVDVDAPLISYLTEHVDDRRFAFRHWNVSNAMYNPKGEPLETRPRLPVPRRARYDVIWMYSVITHTAPRDAEALFALARRHVKRGGGMLFSAFVDEAVETFEDRVPERPLLNAYYGEAYLRRLVSRAAWRVDARYDGWQDGVTQNLFVCRPVSRLRAGLRRLEDCGRRIRTFGLQHMRLVS